MDDSLIAFRTRSKMPLKDVPLGQLEAELRAPDITPDMYDPNTADDEDWKMWLGGLMNDDVGNEGNCFCLHLLSSLSMVSIVKFSLVKILRKGMFSVDLILYLTIYSKSVVKSPLPFFC